MMIPLCTRIIIYWNEDKYQIIVFFYAAKSYF